MYTPGTYSPLHVLIAQTIKNQDLYKPLFLKLSNTADKAKFDELINNTQGLQVFDTIKEQVAELLRCLNPLIIFSPKEILEQTISKKLGNSDEYGVWVYYSWSNKLVHLLDEEEFIIVRTNRNKYKITEEEQQLLATKKIGIMGLSVGQSVALTLAMERGFGELRIADFDELDLSNINRIRTGVQNIKLKKTVIVAREIAEIDPFLNVVCYHDGITE
ncbi:ThiF family adenylyltransferase, partial [Pedobacter sp.]